LQEDHQVISLGGEARTTIGEKEKDRHSLQRRKRGKDKKGRDSSFKEK